MLEKSMMYTGEMCFSKIPKININSEVAMLISTKRSEVISESSSFGVERKTPVGMLIENTMPDIEKTRYSAKNTYLSPQTTKIGKITAHMVIAANVMMPEFIFLFRHMKRKLPTSVAMTEITIKKDFSLSEMSILSRINGMT